MSDLTQNSVKANVKYVSLQEITTKIGSGATPIGGKESYKDHGISLIRSLNVYDFSFKYQDLAFIDENQARKLGNVEVEPKDILLTITGASVGRCTFVPKQILPARVNQHVSIIRLNPEIADSLYVLYTINSRHFKSSLLNLSQTGATREALTKEDICGFKIPIPPLPTQRKIAAVLSAYDDLIENNDRRITLLEKMAEEIYREWFVRLRFPGCEQVTFHKGIPEDWKVTDIGNLYNIKSGFAFKSDDLKSGILEKNGYQIIKIGNINGSGIDIEKCEKFIGELSNRILKFELFDGDLLIAMTGAQIGKNSIFIKNEKRFLLNQRVGKFFPKSKALCNNLYMFFTAQTENFQGQILNYALGAAQPNISGQQIERIKILLPPNELLIRYSKLCDPILKEKYCFERTNRILKQTRDRLLTRLISGKLSVEDLDIQLPPSMTADS